MAAKAPTVIDLVWSDRLTFDATLPATSLVIDSGGVRGPSPVELLGAALAGCMSVDLAHILKRGRHAFTALRSKLVAERSPDEPHRIMCHGDKPVVYFLTVSPHREPTHTHFDEQGNRLPSRPGVTDPTWRGEPALGPR